MVLFSMRLPNVLKDIGVTGKSARAELAVVWPFTRVNIHVVLVAELVDKSLLTDGALKGHVSISRVVLQDVTFELSLAALLATMLASDDSVDPTEVGIEALLVLKNLAALRTLGRFQDCADPLVVVVSFLRDTWNHGRQREIIISHLQVVN